METSYINVHIWNVHMYMHANGNFIYMNTKWKLEMETPYINVHKWIKHILHTQCIKVISTYGANHIMEILEPQILLFFFEILCSHVCATDRLVDACEQDILMDTKADGLAEEPGWGLLWMPSKQTCWYTWTVLSLVLLFAVDAQQMDLLVHMDTVDFYCYCSLWMPQQMDMLLHMDIVNTVIIVIIVITVKFVILVILVCFNMVILVVMVWHLMEKFIKLCLLY